MYKILNNTIEMDDYALQKLKYAKGIQYLWYKIWGNTSQNGTPTPSTPIDVLGCGDSTAILPKAYQQVDYIESTGTQYINTNFNPSGNTKYILNVMFTSISATVKYFIGAQDATNRNNVYLNNERKFSAGYGGVFYNTDKIADTNIKYNTVLDKNLFYVDGELLYTFPPKTFNNAIKTYLFARNNGGQITGGPYVRMYDCKIYDDDVLVRNYIPCYRKSDNEVGLYDTVNDVFYANAGTGEFLYGNEIPTKYEIPIICDNEIKNIYLEEPLHKINDYADILSYSDHNVTRKIKKLVLNGTEDILRPTARVFRLPVSDAAKTSGKTVVCTHFLGVDNLDSPSSNLENNEICTSLSSSIYTSLIYIKSDNISTLEDFKTYLTQQYAAGTPVTVWYVLATEETEEISAIDIQADTYTSITVDTFIQPSQVDFTTKGGHVPQPSTISATKRNIANRQKQIEEDNLRKEEFLKEIAKNEKQLDEVEEYAEIKEIEKKGEEYDKSDKSE